MLDGWFKMRPSCGVCGLLFDRGSHDYFIGAYLINLIASELIFAIGLGVWLLNTWPEIPWDTLQWVAIFFGVIHIFCLPYFFMSLIRASVVKVQNIDQLIWGVH